MDLTGTKAVVLVLLGLIKLFSGIAPLLFTRILKKRNEKILKKFIGVVLCFGGGILLSTVLIHMVREVRDSLQRATDLGMIPQTVDYPFAELLVGMGFLLILLIESVVHKFFGGHGHSHFPSQETLARKVVSSEQGREGVDNTGYVVEADQPQRETRDQCNVYSVSKSYSSDSDSSTLETESKTDRQRKRSEKKVLASLRSFLVVLALSVHSLFEGMAIGLEESDSGVWKLLLAVSIHAVPIVFCMGTDMISIGVKKIRIIIYMIVLSINTPIGILVGILVTAHLEEASGQHILVIGVLQGLAAGTLLYITFFEVLARDKLAKYGMSGLLGALAVMIGFTLMAGIEAQGHGHSHGGHGAHHVDIHQHHQHSPVSEDFHKDHFHGDPHHVHDGDETHHYDHEGGEDSHHYHDSEDDHHHDHDGEEDHHHDHEAEDDHHHDHDGEEDHHHDHEAEDDHHHDHEVKEEHHHDQKLEEDHHHGHEDEDDHNHDHERDNNDKSMEIETFSAKSTEYFEYNVTDPKFLHDSIAYD